MNAPPLPVDPKAAAVYSAAKMGKATIFESPRLLVGLNAFEPGQEHASHAHAGADKVYLVVEGEGLFTLAGAEHRLRAGQVLAAPPGSPRREERHAVAIVGIGRHRTSACGEGVA